MKAQGWVLAQLKAQWVRCEPLRATRCLTGREAQSSVPPHMGRVYAVMLAVLSALAVLSVCLYCGS